MSKIQWLADFNNTLTAEQRFKQWFDSKFDEDYKRDVATAIKEGLKPLRDKVVDNVKSSNLRNVADLAQGVVMWADPDKAEGKVHILGKKGKGGFLRIFELGTYKTPSHKPQIKAREWFTEALNEVGGSIEQNTINALRNIMEKRGIIN